MKGDESRRRTDGAEGRAGQGGMRGIRQGRDESVELSMVLGRRSIRARVDRRMEWGGRHPVCNSLTPQS